MLVRFWGTRGSVAVPGADTLRYGGNTTCVEVLSQENKRLIIDAGTGIRLLGNKMLKEPKPFEILLFITHLHWDHLNGFPFFAPLYTENSKVRVGGWHIALEGLSVLFDSNQGPGHFPVKLEDIGPSMEKCPLLSSRDFTLGNLKAKTTFLNHPQGCLGLHLQEQGKTLAFITDNELVEPGSPSFEHTLDFCRGADVLVHDAQYLPEEMEFRRGYGHSDWQTVVKLAKEARVQRLILTHHDPDRTDHQVEAMVNQARYEAGASLSVEAAFEGLTIRL